MDALPCPSFNAYASSTGIADKVTREDRDDYGYLEPSMAPLQLGNYADEDFEFVTYRESGDEVCMDNCVGPAYPIFNHDVLKEDDSYEKSQKNENATPENYEAVGMSVQTSLRNLFLDEEDRRRGIADPPSSSSSEAGDLDPIPPGSCIWTPDLGKASPSRCKKSNSTGSSSSKRWKLLEFLCRSNSDGKEKFVFLTPSPTMKKKGEKSKISKEECSSSPGSGNIPRPKMVTDKMASQTSSSATGRSKSKVSAHEVFYVRYRALKEVDKKRSYLPYRQELVGFRANLGSFGTKNLPPF